MTSLVEDVTKANSLCRRRLHPESIMARVYEKGLLEEINNYRTGGVSPDGKGGTRPFSKEAMKEICARRIYDAIMRLAIQGVKEKALKYAAFFDREGFVIEDGWEALAYSRSR